ncbi:MAG: bifunctional (p)ppGpp synthetase/guanosine-3',5'-bis(diphosphate) 3'-pyrophosphohydrolase [Gammaproteobacteria bacterium]|nr:bifunctional (p)ppGpp synthetase/guanosine-3',5'-bis(diphosphate) 3'-pyrophosphohydrolase [Gammaproteobacteria bacterium]
MVSLKKRFIYREDGSVDIESWLNKIKSSSHLNSVELITKTCQLAETTSKGLTTFYGQPCIEQGLEIAEIMLDLQMDQQAISAAIMISSIHHTALPLEKITEQLGNDVTKLIRGVQQMEAMQGLQKSKDKAQEPIQIDRLRKLFLALAADIRVVLIKLAERTCILRGIKNINEIERKRIAQETLDIYAPLANRLGIGQLKWELEDIAFRYTDPETYKKISNFLAERRADREERITTIIHELKEQFHSRNIPADISGRAKHIYSIYSKMQRKNVDYKNIYDASAVRILVPSVENCYEALSIVHSLWEHVPEEFDDYIATPKANGYRSIHTAVIGPDGKNLEIQIRTTAMHEEAERGVAAHWVYKESAAPEDYKNKISFLRQLIDWHKEVANDADMTDRSYDQILSDRVYVFTPTGEILDLEYGATPLDCAYQIHSEVGNHCRGAKINGHIVPLTYPLKTGDQIEILINPNGTPSRDWLKVESGYLTSARARAKVAHWFRQQDQSQHIENGRRILEREFPRNKINIQKLMTQFNYKTDNTFLAAIGHGHVRVTQIAHALDKEHVSVKAAPSIQLNKKININKTGTTVAGMDSLLTRIAKCCKPIPGDLIVGFITQGRGVSIHKAKCSNIIATQDSNRLIDVHWDDQHTGYYYVDIIIRAHNRETLLKEITTLLANSKIILTNFNSNTSRSNVLTITLTIQLSATTELSKLLKELQHLNGILSVQRASESGKI